MKTAVEELLRWDSPVQVDGRTVVRRRRESHGTTVAAGEQFVTLARRGEPRSRACSRIPTVSTSAGSRQAPMSFGGGHPLLPRCRARARRRSRRVRPPARPVPGDRAGVGRRPAAVPRLDRVARSRVTSGATGLTVAQPRQRDTHERQEEHCSSTARPFGGCRSRPSIRSRETTEAPAPNREPRFVLPGRETRPRRRSSTSSSRARAAARTCS